MKPEKTYLDKLTPTTKAYKVKVKLKEKSRTLISPQKKTRYQQLLFEDEKGNTMRGALFENQIEEYETVFKSNQEYEIANAPLKPVLGRYATRDDDCQMSFGGQATVQALDPEAKPLEPEYLPIATIPRTTDAGDRFSTHPHSLCQFTLSYAHILTMFLHCTDVLGIVVFVEETRSITFASGVVHQVREIVITDHSTDQPLTISVWDDLTGTEANLLKSWVGPTLIVGFTSLKPSAHKGFSLSTTMATEFHRNPVGERASALRKWSEEKRTMVLDRMARICEARNPAEQSEIVTIDTVKQKQVGNTLQEERHWIKVTIPEPDRSRIVPYVGCNSCGKRTENDCDVSYTCKFCNKENCIATPRITFKFDAADDTGEMTFTAFTQECEALFNLPAAEIYDQIATLPGLPKPLMALFFEMTKDLKEAGAASNSKEERELCALLVNSIIDGDPYTWKTFYNGYAASILSEKTFEILKETVKKFEAIYRIPPCKSPSQLTQPSVPGKKRQGKATKKCRHSSVHAKQTKQAAKKRNPPTKKGKEKMTEIETNCEANADEYSPLPWPGMFLGNGSVVPGTKRYDMYCEGTDGYFYLRTVYQVIEANGSGGRTSGYLSVDDETYDPDDSEEAAYHAEDFGSTI
ncbi:hypothetical protein BVRB_6g148170 [Beta vulgaris subsp. vulgaris]|nr:hypothetical protein BVRB_6g148170 [Beta vulgaris subsp. vulgaris]